MSITSALILANVIIFVLGHLAPTASAAYNIPYPLTNNEESILYIRGSFSWFTCFTEGEFWRLISYQFLHANSMHLLFNMLALYFFGPVVEQVMGQTRYLSFYLACGIAGALFYGLLGHMGFFTLAQDPESLRRLLILSEYTGQAGIEEWQLVPMVGASAAIYGILIAVAFMYPHLRVRLMFPPIEMTLRSLALLTLAFAILTILRNGYNAGGEAGHLGGIILAAIIMSIWKWRFLRRRRNDGIF